MSLYLFGPFELDAERLLLLDGGEPIPIGPKVVETLLALVEHPGELFAKGALLARIWPEGYVDEANLAQNIYVLRKTLRSRWNVEAIETIPRRGYRFIAPVARRDDAQRPQPSHVPAPPAARPSYRGWAVVAASCVALAAVLTLAVAIPRGAGARSGLSAEGSRLYEIGRYYWNLRTRDGIAKSVDYFSRVVDTDPHDARGYAGLASADAMMADYGYGEAPAKVYVARARAYAHKALVLDPDSGEAYAVLGMLATEKKSGTMPNLVEAFKDLRRAIALDPASGPAHEWYGVALLEKGNVTAAYAELNKAAELDPLSVATTAWLGTAAYLERRYGDAVAYARETLDLSPQRGDAYETLGLAYQALGDDARAAAAFTRLAEVCAECRGQAAALLAPIYARAKRPDEARAEIAFAQSHHAEVAPEDLALAFEAVGRRDAALSLLRHARSDYLAAELADDPRFASFRGDARLAALPKPA
ncbi:MAG: winged helix-turn-helix domain-containing protein [Candidatus Eremiobacteraeota bacterium]|nr:winged helix-turn-helix domain-containing protein [Candidatus Eremiobacteraeota bacterium]MBV8498959.1 winged helix-turn-helix domain-containing protein [Candidatus Eremiobacteraeota bacterium]